MIEKGRKNRVSPSKSAKRYIQIQRPIGTSPSYEKVVNKHSPRKDLKTDCLEQEVVQRPGPKRDKSSYLILLTKRVLYQLMAEEIRFLHLLSVLSK